MSKKKYKQEFSNHRLIQRYTYDSFRFHLSIVSPNDKDDLLVIWYAYNKPVGVLVDKDIIDINDDNFENTQLKIVAWLVKNKLTLFLEPRFGIVSNTDRFSDETFDNFINLVDSNDDLDNVDLNKVIEYHATAPTQGSKHHIGITMGQPYKSATKKATKSPAIDFSDVWITRSK